MEEILELASKLGTEIAKHDRYKSFIEAEEQLKKDNEAKVLSEALEKQGKKIQELEKNLKPVKALVKHNHMIF